MTNTVDWPSLESTLFSLVVAELREFANAHPDETVYAFAFDCNSEYGQVMTCLNTPEHYQLAIERKHLPPEILAGYDALIDPSSSYDSEANAMTRARRIKWSIGDWKYLDIGVRDTQANWKPIRMAVYDAFEDSLDDFDEDEDESDNPVASQFMTSVCSVILHLEREGVFDCLRKTEDFYAFAMDHDESFDAARDRIDAMRRA